MNDEIIKFLASNHWRQEELPDWAIRCLEAGFDSKSLRILASMSKANSSSELQDYLQRSLNELGWDKIDKEIYLMRYAEILAKRILENDVDPIEASKEIYQILLDLDYPERLQGWFDVDEMIYAYEYFLETGKQEYYYRPKDELLFTIKNTSAELLKSKEQV